MRNLEGPEIEKVKAFIQKKGQYHTWISSYECVGIDHTWLVKMLEPFAALAPPVGFFLDLLESLAAILPSIPESPLA